ncbi:MAG: V-type ATP synthase subunit C [Methanomicrobiaceae archaeon]|nr:V-type ATP synthase subunit C [Methanomicrobiaceae archaeon]
MADVSTRLAPYVYVCTRMRVRKAKLLPREDYLRMLNMSLTEITRFIEETEYKSEIDELGSSFSGIDLVEVALSWNLAKEYQKILEITPGALHLFTQSYLRRWDIQNFLTILRGKHQGVAAGRIKEVLIPAGKLDREFLDRLLTEDSVERITEAMRGKRLYPVLERELPGALETKSFARLENELYKGFYSELLSDVKSGVKGGSVFLAYIRLEIDFMNVRNLFRLRSGAVEGDIRDLMIPDGSFSIDELQRIAVIENAGDFIDEIQKKAGLKSITGLLEDLRNHRPIHEIEIELTRFMLAEMERLSKRYPVSICPILVYLEKKKYEVQNLRALARGKESNLPAERIKSYLVV